MVDTNSKLGANLLVRKNVERGNAQIFIPQYLHAWGAAFLLCISLYLNKGLLRKHKASLIEHKSPNWSSAKSSINQSFPFSPTRFSSHPKQATMFFAKPTVIASLALLSGVSAKHKRSGGGGDSGVDTLQKSTIVDRKWCILVHYLVLPLCNICSRIVLSLLMIPYRNMHWLLWSILLLVRHQQHLPKPRQGTQDEKDKQEQE